MLDKEHIRQIFDLGYISREDYLTSLAQLGDDERTGINDWFDTHYSGGVKEVKEVHPEWFVAFKKFKELHPEHGGGEHEVSYEAGFNEGIRANDRDQNAIYMEIREAANAIENGKPKKAEIILLRMIKDAT